MTAVYRRLLIVRAAEQLGVGLLVASAMAVILLPLATLRGMPAWPIISFAAATAVLIGLVRLIGHWPTRDQAISQADSQLRFNELLITALSQQSYGDAEFRAVIIAQANARCDAHEPSEVLLRRMGVRSWSAVGLVMSLATVLAIIPLGPARSSAVDTNSSVLTVNSIDEPKLMKSGGGVVTASDPMSQGSSNNAMSNGAPVQDAHGGTSNEGSGTSQNHTGTGGGSASSESNPTADHRHDQTSGRTGVNTGTPAGGGAAESSVSSGQFGSGGSSAGSKGEHQATPAWTGTGDHSAGGGQTPDRGPAEDRDLIRDFFAR